MATDDTRASAQDGFLTQILASKTFARIPKENLKKIVSSIEMLPVSAGETIIRQGEVGDSFYILREGRCRVVSYASVEDATVEIASLGPGDSFGEEALIRNAPRNATVEMISDGSLARLRKQDFVTLIQKPLLQGLAPAGMQQKIADSAAAVLDVRGSADYAKYSIPGSRNIPLDFLRQARKALDMDMTYIACSDNELESALAAFVLAQKGFNACYLSSSVADYLRTTGEYDRDHVDLPGGHEEIVIELPEEYAQTAAASVLVEGRSSGLPDQGVAPQPPGTPAEQIAQLRREFRQALDDQSERHSAEMRALKEQLRQLLDARFQALIKELRARYAELAGKLAALGQK
ncbi:MAG: cyclic nucleotide-binding domain-containing protein [Chromatiales bacterium]